MLGSAIPRRWVISLALVGLVSILAATYTAMWTDPARADSEGQGTGTGTGTGFPADQDIEEVTIPQGVVLSPGQQTIFSATLYDANGVARLNFPDTVFEWQISGGAATISGSTTGRSVVIVANSAGAANVQLRVDQGLEDLTAAASEFFIRLATINVQTPGPTATPVTPPTNPGPVPGSIPNSDGVVAPEDDLLITSDGVETGNNPENRDFNDRPALYIQTGSVRDFYGVTVDTVNPTTLPPLPTGINRGSSAADIKFVTKTGAQMVAMRLERAAKICLPVAASDLTGAGGGFTGLRVLRYDGEVSQWVVLNTSYNTITDQACAQTAQFSNFALGLLQQQATPGPGGGLPATGGWSPSIGLMALAGLVGIVLVGGGAVTLRRARQESREE